MVRHFHLCYINLLSLFKGAIPGSGSYISYVWPFGIIDLNCTGEEDSVWNCSYNGTVDYYTCPSNHDASIICQGIYIIILMCIIIIIT